MKFPIYCRIVSADKDRGYVMLFSWIRPVVQRTCHLLSTLTNVTQEQIDNLKAETLIKTSASEIIDVTEPSILKKIQKLTEKPNE